MRVGIGVGGVGVLLLVGVACVGSDESSSGFVGADASAGTSSGGPGIVPGADGGTTPTADGGDPADTCDLNKPFGTPDPTPFNLVNTTNIEESPYLLADELTIYFSALRGPTATAYDLFRATRRSRSVVFEAAEPLPGLVNEAGDVEEHGPVVSEDERTIFFTKRSSSTQSYDMWSATRATTTAAWSAGTPMAGYNTPAIEGPCTLADGDLWACDNNGIFRLPKSGTSFGAMVRHGELGADARNPTLTGDGLTVYYVVGALGARVIHHATRSPGSPTFTPLGAVTELGPTADDLTGWVSKNGCRLYFTRSRAGSSRDLFVATKPPR